MPDFRKLHVWGKAHAITLQVYAKTKRFPRDETYGLSAQMRRAAVSVESNIAEGTGRPTPGEVKQFLGYAQGSVHELQCQFLIARGLGYLTAPEHDTLEVAIREVRAMLEALRRRQ